MAASNGAPADPAAAGGVHDRDLDLPLDRPSRWRRRRGTYQGYQRLVANPFLALLAMIVWCVLVKRVVDLKRLDLFLATLACLVPVLFLFQFHCLDCGATGRLWRWREHACEPVRLRCEAGRMRSLRALTPVAQTMLWFYVVGLGAVVALILRR